MTTLKPRDYLDVGQAQDKSTFIELLIGVAADAGFGIASGGLAVDRGPGIGGDFEPLRNAPAAPFPGGAKQILTPSTIELIRPGTGAEGYCSDARFRRRQPLRNHVSTQAPFVLSHRCTKLLYSHGNDSMLFQLPWYFRDNDAKPSDDFGGAHHQS